jgi:hypothetical protein
VSARRFVAGFWITSMVISGVLGALIFGFHGAAALIWGAAALFVPVGLLLAPAAAKGAVPSPDEAAMSAATLLSSGPAWILERDPDPIPLDGGDPAPAPVRPDPHPEPAAPRPWVAGAGLAIAGGAVWLLSRIRGSSRR